MKWKGRKGVFTIQQALYFGFGIVMLTSVLVMMSSFYSTIEPLSQEIGMKDVLKTIKTATIKVYLEGKYMNAESSVLYLKVPRKISGSKYRIEFNQSGNEFCFTFPERYCEHMYLLDENVSITADIDSSKNTHEFRYYNSTIQVN